MVGPVGIHGQQVSLDVATFGLDDCLQQQFTLLFFMKLSSRLDQESLMPTLSLAFDKKLMPENMLFKHLKIVGLEGVQPRAARGHEYLSKRSNKNSQNSKVES